MSIGRHEGVFHDFWSRREGMRGAGAGLAWRAAQLLQSAAAPAVGQDMACAAHRVVFTHLRPAGTAPNALQVFGRL
jgi:hypothetical protein